MAVVRLLRALKWQGATGSANDNAVGDRVMLFEYLSIVVATVVIPVVINLLVRTALISLIHCFS